MSNKVYIGKVKSVQTKFGQIIKVSFGPNDLEKLQEHKNAASWVNMEILTGRDGQPYMQIDTFKPSGQGGGSAPAPAVNQQSANDDLPF